MARVFIPARLRRAARLSAALALCAGAAMAQNTASNLQYQRAYDAAIKCFVVGGVATGERRDAGDAAKSAAYETKARLSFDTATKLGQRLGYSGSRVNQDFGLAEARELPKLVGDVNYYRSAAATCRAIGLM